MSRKFVYQQGDKAQQPLNECFVLSQGDDDPKPVNIPKITFLLDNEYQLDKLITTLKAVHPGIMRKIRF